MTTASKIWIVVVLIALIGVYEWLIKSPTTAPPRPIPISMDHMTQKVLLGAWDNLVSLACKPARGNANADWTMLEIGDFQCPQCGRVHKEVEALVDRANGKVALYFINWPLNIHNNSRRAALAALAAEDQGKFWPMYDAIYENQKGIDQTSAADADSTLLDDANIAKLDIAKYEKDRKSLASESRLEAQTQLVISLGTQSTPTFLLRKKGSQVVYFFIGSSGQDQTASTPAYPGLNYLQARPPWDGATLPPPPDVAPAGTYHGPTKTASQTSARGSKRE